MPEGIRFKCVNGAATPNEIREAMRIVPVRGAKIDCDRSVPHEGIDDTVREIASSTASPRQPRRCRCRNWFDDAPNEDCGQSPHVGQ